MGIGVNCNQRDVENSGWETIWGTFASLFFYVLVSISQRALGHKNARSVFLQMRANRNLPRSLK
jgi:hypothetical protein